MAGVTTIFCDDKFNKQAKSCGITPGQAYDLRTGYNINDPKVRDEITRYLRTEKPDLVVGSPICGPFSQMNHTNDQTTEAAKAKKKMAVDHLKFTFECFEIQIKENNKYVLVEHPWSAESWGHEIVERAKACLGMKIDRCDQCCFATKEYTDRHGTTGLIKKPAGFMTNCPEIGHNLNKTFTACHKHVDLFGGLPQKSQAYSEELVRAVLRGLKTALLQGKRAGLFTSKGDLRGVSKPPPEHYITHFPKHEGSEVCQDSKPQAAPHRRRKKKRTRALAKGEVPPPPGLDRHPPAKAFRDLVSADHAVISDKDGYFLRNDKHALIIQDKATYFSLAEPVKNKTAEESTRCFREFLTAEEAQAVKLVHSDNAKELKVAVQACGIRHDESIPNVPQTNGISEAAVKRAKQGTVACLDQSGMASGYWAVAMKYWCRVHNCAEKIQDTESPFEGKTP